ncbi:GAP family protein [Chlorogloeopsis sp. ULAP01]|uniref:GAP family protein n=1 Tax=Chlorogloeopsis sp. ULAP01 TaxID=3056483 RepID=UPI0025AA3B2F|nr:GAP family protein [Chlorogloeopsis sp. ULAP01]MDM9383892.1 GAP family protein [Chlorogloeopsis sp. ULAP01]
METVLISLLPYIIGSAIVPLQIIIGLLLLKSPNQGLFKAVAYVAGMTITRLLQGLIFGLVLSGSSALTEGSNGKNPIVSTLLLVLGILLLIAAYKKWRREDDPDDSPPKGLTMIDSLTPLRAFGIGLGLPLIAAKLWVFTLSALATIAAAQLGQLSSTIVYLLFILLAESLLLLPILARILIPERSKYLLSELSAWLTKNSRSITIVVSLVFGLFFLHSGITGLLS